MNEQWIAFKPWCMPFVRSNRVVRLFEGKRDVTDEIFPIDHSANRLSCQRANQQNAVTAERFGIRRGRPYYHYDALTGRALEFEVPHNSTG